MYGAHHPERWPGEDVRGFCIRLVLGVRFSGPSCPPPYPTCDAGSIPPIKTLGDSSAAQWCILESENRFFDHATGSGGGAGVTKNDIQMPALILSHGETIFQIYRWASCHLPVIHLLIREGLAAMPGSIKKQGMAGSLRPGLFGDTQHVPGKDAPSTEHTRDFFGIKHGASSLPDAVLCFESDAPLKHRQWIEQITSADQHTR